MKRQNQSDRKAGGRVFLLDSIRGAAVVNMVAYHAVYDLIQMFGLPLGGGLRRFYPWQQAICITFILIAGISFQLSRKPWRNALERIICAGILTAVTALAMPSELIMFGIIHFLAAAVLLTILCQPLLKKIPTGAGFLVSLIIFVLIRHIAGGWIGLSGLWVWELPPALYASRFLFWLGFPSAQFYSADYFAVLPWIFLYWAGYFGGRWWIKGSGLIRNRTAVPESGLYRLADKSLGAVGRTSLWVYMLHQPVIYGILLWLDRLGQI